MKKLPGLLLIAAAILIIGFAVIMYLMDIAIVVETEADTIRVTPLTSSDIRVRVGNTGKGEAHAFLEVTMPFFEGAVIDSIPESTPSVISSTPGIGRSDVSDSAVNTSLMLYDPQPPWTKIKEWIEGDVIKSVYYFGKLGSGMESTYFITSWKYNNFRISFNQCGKYTWDEINAGAEKIRFDGYGVSTLKTRETDPKVIWEKMSH